MEQTNLEKAKVGILFVGLVFGGVAVYYNYFHKIISSDPSVTVKSADYVKGEAQITVNGVEQTLYSGSTLSVGNGWGVKFSPHQNIMSRQGNYKAVKQPYRIELVKDHLVIKYLDIQKIKTEQTV